MAPNDDLIHSLVESQRKIATQMAAIEKTLEHFIAEFQRERDGAGQHRRDLREVITSLSAAVRTLSERVEEMRPDVADYRNRRAEAQGAAKLGRFLWAALVAISGLIGALAARGIEMFWGRPPYP